MFDCGVQMSKLICSVVECIVEVDRRATEWAIRGTLNSIVPVFDSDTATIRGFKTRRPLNLSFIIILFSGFQLLIVCSDHTFHVPDD